MAEEMMGADQIKDTDIVFECPHCTKSLAIDQKASGLMIICPDCGERIQVPEREYEEEDVPIVGETYPHGGTTNQQIQQLSTALTASQKRVQELVTEMAQLKARRKVLEQGRTDYLRTMERIRDELTIIQGSMDRIVDALQIAQHDDFA